MRENNKMQKHQTKILGPNASLSSCAFSSSGSIASMASILLAGQFGVEATQTDGESLEG
jgi:hypothetical protein